MRNISGTKVGDGECAYLICDTIGNCGIMVFAFWVDEKEAALRRLRKANRKLSSISIIEGNIN